ncbi:MAG: alpha-mannosidase, partial [Acidobacteriaceae bacterium]
MLSVSALAFAFPSALHAQSAAEIAKSLTPAENAVVTRLGELNTLPSGQWRYHAGDVPHGEDTSVDDSAWPVAKPGAEGPNEAIWYRQWIEVPKTLHGYDLTGTRIWFQFDATANGPIPQIIYFNGRRVAMGDDLERIVLFDQAKPGEKVLVAVKLLPTVDKKRFNGAEMHIDFAPSRPNPDDERTEFISAAFLVPSLSKNVAGDQATLSKAISEVDL